MVRQSTIDTSTWSHNDGNIVWQEEKVNWSIFSIVSSQWNCDLTSYIDEKWIKISRVHETEVTNVFFSLSHNYIWLLDSRNKILSLSNTLCRHES